MTQSSFETDLRKKYPNHNISPLKNTKHTNVLQLKDPKGKTFVAKTVWHDKEDPKGDMGIEVMDKRFQTEVRVLQMLPSWWALHYYDHFKTTDNRIIVTDEINSTPWASYKSTKKKDALMAKALMKQVRWLHSKKIAHGDLALKNIMLSANGEPVIIDFEKSIVRASKAKMHEDYVNLLLSISDVPIKNHIIYFLNQALLKHERKTRKNKTIKVSFDY
jgi:serine/threonine protein kinase